MLLSRNLLLCTVVMTFLASCGDKPADKAVVTPEVNTKVPAAKQGMTSGNHNEVPIGSVEIGGATIVLAQGHGPMDAGHESHLVVKLPTNKQGATIVRAWIGTSDRTLSMVGKGTYNASHDDYDLHVTAPDPMPLGVQWWIEIEKSGGTKAVGSATPILKGDLFYRKKSGNSESSY